MIGSTLGNYKILEKLGEGGQGTVYKAVDSKLGRTLVIKVLPAELTSKEANLKRFEREARLASALDHPNICTIFDLNEINGIHYIAMQYIEWGNPNEKPAFDYMNTYSPYDNLSKQNYPAMLVKVSVNDSQVPYWEGAKLVAKLRTMKTDHNPLLLKVNFGAGHGGSSGRYDALRETAFDFAFMLWQMGVAD
jgi:serine/threonine protein kinase